jgi:hypothetical protein
MPNGEEGGHGGGRLTDLPGELKKWADAIKATAEAIDAVANTIEGNATRSVILEVNNTTGRVLALHGSGDHDWGGFRELPPDAIPPRTSRLFTSQSNGFLTGTSGSVQYRLDDEGTIFHLEWSNPFLGDNESHCRVEGPHADFYLTNSVTGGGNTRAHQRYMLGEKADAAPRHRDWMTCAACKGLVHSLAGGHCPARPLGMRSAPSAEQVERMVTPLPGGLRGAPSAAELRAVQGLPPLPEEPREPANPEAGSELFGKHETAGYIFQLPYGVNGPNRQGGWRKCGRCQALFNDGGGRGRCPGRHGGHAAEAEGIEYYLPYAMPLRPAEQDNWRYCDRCGGLFFFPQNGEGLCAAGGSHHAASESYVLEHL